MSKLFELHQLRPEEVEISVFAKTNKDKGLINIVNTESQRMLKNLIKLAEINYYSKNSIR